MTKREPPWCLWSEGPKGKHRLNPPPRSPQDRRVYCSDACRQARYRFRTQQTELLPRLREVHSTIGYMVDKVGQAVGQLLPAENAMASLVLTVDTLVRMVDEGRDVSELRHYVGRNRKALADGMSQYARWHKALGELHRLMVGESQIPAQMAKISDLLDPPVEHA